VGEARKGWRDRVVLSTKNHYFGEDEKEWWQNLENSLERLQTDRIDIYNTHGVNKNDLENNVRPRIAGWLQKARDQGMIRHICTSFHDNNDALRAVVDSGIYEVITLQYNLLDRRLEDGIAYAHEKNVGVVVMGPVGGGRLGSSSEVLSEMVADVNRVPELALRFVLANPNVTIALSGMSTMEHVVENLAVASDTTPLSTDDKAAIDRQLERLAGMANLYCTGCGYCKPCPKGVDIPRVFKLYNEARVYGLWDHSRANYARWRENMKEGALQADSCGECGECLDKCPQKIDIPTQLGEAHAALTQQEGVQNGMGKVSTSWRPGTTDGSGRPAGGDGPVEATVAQQPRFLSGREGETARVGTRE